MNESPDIAQTLFINTHDFSELPHVLSFMYCGNYYRGRVLHAQIDHQNLPTKQKMKPHSHNVYHIVLVTGGRGAFILGEREISVREGNLIVVSPGVKHCFMNALGETVKYSELTFEFCTDSKQRLAIPFHEMVSVWVNRPCTSLERISTPQYFRRHLVEMIREMVEGAIEDQTDTDLFLASELSRLLYDLYKQFMSPEPGGIESPVEIVRSYIHRNYTQQISLTQLADIAYLSPNYLSRHFKARFGQTPINYLNCFRIEASCATLLSTDDPIRFVAEKTGFQDHHYFSKVFKKTMGRSPGRYREKMRKQGE